MRETFKNPCSAGVVGINYCQDKKAITPITMGWEPPPIQNIAPLTATKKSCPRNNLKYRRGYGSWDPPWPDDYHSSTWNDRGSPRKHFLGFKAVQVCLFLCYRCTRYISGATGCCGRPNQYSLSLSCLKALDQNFKDKLQNDPCSFLKWTKRCIVTQVPLSDYCEIHMTLNDPSF